MGNEVPIVPFADIVEIISGGTPKTSIAEYWGGEIPWLTVTDFNTGYRWVNSADKTITDLGVSNSATTILNQGDVIISARGTVGVIAQIARPMAFNQSCYGIRGKMGLSNTDFIYYALKNAVSQILQVAYGGVFNTITRDTFKIIKTRLPHIKEQEAIACILGALDDKIEINRQMCKTLEDTAQAIFKNWFIDFDPVHTKAAGMQPEGLKPEIAALFPDSFEDSELGKIPKGWIISRLGDHFHLTMGQSPPGNTYNEDGIGEPFYQGRSDFGFRFPRNRVYCTAPKRYAEKGDTLVSVRAPVGDINMAFEHCAIGRGVAAVRHIGGSSIFTYYSMKQLRNNFVSFEAEGSVFGSITKGDFLNLPFIAPSIALIESFDQSFAVLENSIESYELESITLTSIRDSLLPRLISGELKVKDAERIASRLI